MSSSDTSSLSSAPPTDDESMAMTFETNAPITNYFKEKEETPPPARSPSPPHEYTLADNPDIAFIVMFRARFSDVFPKSLPHYGPQDIERGVQDPVPGEHVERLLCALLGLVLNRKKDVEKGHYQRALEDAVQTHANQWPRSWQGKNPLHGGRTFATMSPEERLSLLKALILWALSSSDAVQAKIKECYKQTRHDDDLNQPLSVQPWGRDDLKRRFWLIEGQDDTHFRLYRESNPALKNNTWFSVAGNIPELKAVAERLEKEKSVHSKRLSEKIKMAIPRFEGSEEKRKRRDYRLARKAQFARPEPGFSLYEGRTRGKKMKYTYSDDEDIFSDDMPSTRRSTRNSGVSTPAEPAGPVFTASGRQVRTRTGGIYGESMLSSQRRDDAQLQNGANTTGRPRRSTRGRVNGYGNRNYVDEMDDESEAASSGNELKGDEEYQNEFEGDDEDESSEDESMMDGEEGDPPSLVVQLRYGKGRKSNSPRQETAQSGPAVDEATKAGPPDTVQDLPPKPEETQVSHPTEVERKPSEVQVSSASVPVEPQQRFDDSKENISNEIGVPDQSKSEDTGLKVAPELSVVPLSPSRVHNGSE
ncbi:hypothetical protein VTN77DRAFT_829 [Rasamsonia byssochlamydoides]|uniref:uncharacterized protein n=1 Tax=Rasamsonia byssochlamydoides TaxID=89139 RepID=UPI00374266FD